MYFGLRTDLPIAELYLHDKQKQVAVKTWQADRELAKGLLAQIETFLHENNTSFDKLNGLFVFEGPGSFTGLRIGITVMNTMAYAQNIAIVGAQGETWAQDATNRLTAGENDNVVLPFYGAEARITTPKK